MPSVVILIVIMLYVVILNVVILSVVMLGVVMLSFIPLNASWYLDGSFSNKQIGTIINYGRKKFYNFGSTTQSSESMFRVYFNRFLVS